MLPQPLAQWHGAYGSSLLPGAVTTGCSLDLNAWLFTGCVCVTVGTHLYVPIFLCMVVCQCTIMNVGLFVKCIVG